MIERINQYKHPKVNNPEIENQKLSIFCDFFDRINVISAMIANETNAIDMP